MTHHYQAFGLHILSEIEFSNLPAAQDRQDAQVSISLAALPQNLPGLPATRRYFQASQGKLLVQIRGVGRILVEDGQRITFEPQAGADPLNIRQALINMGLSAILHQRGALALHASAVATPAGAVLFCGIRRAGKSTLAAGLHKRGWPLVCDDKAALHLNEEQVIVIPSFPELRLWRDAIEHLNMANDSMEKTSESEKFNLGIKDGYQSAPLPLRTVYLLKPGAAQEISLRPLNGMDKFQTIKQHTYTNQFLKDLGLLPAHFNLASAIAARIPIIEIARPAAADQLDALVALIDSELRKM
jgi:hypothetical protein